MLSRLIGILAVSCFTVPTHAALDPNDEANKPAEIMPLAAQSLLLDVAQAGARLVAVGGRGHVLLSDDQGLSWRQATAVPTRTMLTGVFFVDAEYGWAVGHDETILATTDGGETWQRVYFAPEAQQPFFDLWFADRQRGIVVGAYGAYFTTTDGGATWTGSKFDAAPIDAAAPEDEFAPDYHLNRIVPGGDRLFIAAEAGHLYRSADGGESWQTLPSPYEGSFYGLLPLAGDELLAFGLRGNLWRSADAGASWTQIETGTTAMLTDGLRLDSSQLVIAGLSGVLLVSSDGGASWTLQQLSDRKGIAALAPATDETVVTVGEAGVKRVALGEQP
ncbi:MAG: YCF48-related protein [Steroidobacteraceae bacterium]|nr:YCF48-related protein [Steroidobacteraceae bacterium]